MPVMDGFESSSIISNRLKESNLPKIPIIGLSGYSEEAI